MHAVHQLLSIQSSEQRETVLIQTQMSQCWSDSQPTWSRWPASSFFISPSDKPQKETTLYLVGIEEKLDKIVEGSSFASRLDLFLMETYRYLLLGEFIMLISSALK